MIKKFLKILVFTVIGLLLALILLPYVYGDEIKDGLKDAINNEINAEVDFDDIGVSFLKSFPDVQVRLDGFTIEGKDTFKDVMLAEIETIDIDLSLTSVIKKSEPYQIRSFTAHQPHINLWVTKDNQANYLITKPSETTSSYNGEIEKYEVIDGVVTYRNDVSSMSMSIGNLNHTGKGNFTQDEFDLITDTKLEDLTLKVDGINYLKGASASANGTLLMDLLNEKYTLGKNKMRLNGLDFELNGYFQFKGEDLYQELSLNADQCDFGKLFSLVPGAYTADYKDAEIYGEGNITADVKGIYDAVTGRYPAFHLDLNTKDGRIKYPLLPNSIGVKSFDMRINHAGNDLSRVDITIPAYDVRLGSDRIHGNMDVIWSENNADIDGKMTGNMNLESWKDFLPLEKTTSLQGKLDIDAIIKSDLKTIQSEQYEDVVFSGNASVENLDVEMEGSPRIKVERLNLTADPEKLLFKGEKMYYGASDFDLEGSIYKPLEYITDNKVEGLISFKGNRLQASDFLVTDTTATTAPSTPVDLPALDLTIDGEVQELIYDRWTLKNLRSNAQVKDGSVVLEKLTGHIEGDAFALSGKIDNYEAAMDDQGKVSGKMRFTSASIDADKYLTDDEGTENPEAFQLPENMDIDLDVRIDKLNYDGITLKDVNAQGKLEPGKFVIQKAESSSLGGILSTTGLLSTSESGNPEFNFRIDLGKIQFSEAFQNLESFSKLAPIAEFISGYFNSTLIMSGSLTDDLSLDLGKLTAQGYIETLNSYVKGYKPLTSLADKVNLKNLSEWALENTKNWFEIKEGTVTLKDHTYHLGDGINLTIGGNHHISDGMSYKILAEIPRELLRKNPVSGALDQGVSFLEKEASKLGINVQQGELLLLDIGLSGSLLNPQIQITPVGTAGKPLDEMAKDELLKKQEEIKEKIETKIADKKEEIRDTIQDVVNEVKDTATAVVNEKIDEAKDTIAAVVKETGEKYVDSLLQKVPKDTVATKVLDILQEKTGKEVDDIKKQLEDFNPFKKKKKKEVKKDTIK